MDCDDCSCAGRNGGFDGRGLVTEFEFTVVPEPRTAALVMAGLVETSVRNAMHALHTGNNKLASTTILADHRINRSMRRIDASCHKFIALHLPSAGHLRLLSSVIRANIELERIGDYAVTISREVSQMSVKPPKSLALMTPDWVK